MYTTKKKVAPHRFDIVGSFLRPERVKKARLEFQQGVITASQLKNIEDDEIKTLIQKQKEANLPVITDGEFRRSYWHLDFMWGFHGVEEIELEHGYFFHGEETTKGSIALTGKISGEHHPFVEHFKYVKQFEDDTTTARQTIPAPAQMLAELYRGDNRINTEKIYPNYDELIQDIATAYQQVIAELYEAGCRNIQLDDCTWGMLVDKGYWEQIADLNTTLEIEANRYLKINNLAIEGRPEDLALTMHICRGNYHSTFASSGGYDSVAPYVFAKTNVDAFYLEYDDERSGTFDSLSFVPENKKVVLGLITTKSPVLEEKEAIIHRIHEVEKYIPLERLYLSPQCGFASCEIGNKLTEEEQWNKLALVKEIAQEVWNTTT
ncbi:MAG: 5-methyltetrahydropteroyltriglutamate--homocysteine S-methyltransferase [Lachnospiraceae bacterium]